MKKYSTLFYSALFLMSFSLQAAQLEKSKSGLIIIISDERTGEVAQVIQKVFTLPCLVNIELADGTLHHVAGYQFPSGMRVLLDSSDERRHSPEYKIIALPKDHTGQITEAFE